MRELQKALLGRPLIRNLQYSDPKRIFVLIHKYVIAKVRCDREVSMTSKLLVVFSLLLVLAGCAPSQFTGYWRSGVTVAQQQNDLTNCQVRAANQVPVSTQVRTTPTYTTPENTSCYNIGYSVNCTTTGGQVYGGDTYSYDVNADLRQRVVGQCMARRGYQAVTLPICGDEERALGIVSFRNSRLPPAREVRCVTDAGYVPSSSPS